MRLDPRLSMVALLAASFGATAQIPVVTPDVAVFVLPDGTPFRSASRSLDIDGDTAVVGNPADDAAGEDVGAVYVFGRQPDDRWVLTSTLHPTDPRDCDGFGASVVVEGDVILVRRRGHTSTSHGCMGPALGHDVRIFERFPEGWRQTLTLPYSRSLTVDIADGYAVVGKRSLGIGADVYHRMSPGDWQGPTFLPEVGLTGGDDDFVGVTARIAGNRVVIGTLASGPDVYYRSSFLLRANVYERDASGNWQLDADIITDQERLSVGRNSPSVSVGEDAIAIQGQIYERSRYGGWYLAADTTPTDTQGALYTASQRNVVELLPGGNALVRSAVTTPVDPTGTALLERTDLYHRDTNQIWQPATRVEVSKQRSQTTTAHDGTLRLVATDPDGYLFTFTLDPDAVHSAPRISSARAVGDVILVGNEVQLHVSVDDYNHAPLVPGIRNVEYRIGAGEWRPMQPVDGAFGERNESASAYFRVGTGNVSPTSTTRICVRVTGMDGSVAELLDRPGSSCPVVVAISYSDVFGSGDREPPAVNSLDLYRTQVRYGQDNSIYAFADDSNSGGSRIVAMQYRIDDGIWQEMKPANLPFNQSSMETGYAVLAPMTEPGSHSICVRAIDSSARIGNAPCLSFEVTW